MPSCNHSIKHEIAGLMSIVNRNMTLVRTLKRSHINLSREPAMQGYIVSKPEITKSNNKNNNNNNNNNNINNSKNNNNNNNHNNNNNDNNPLF